MGKQTSEGCDPPSKDPFLCRVAGHRRSRQLAFTEGHGIWKSRCKRCGANMVRSRGGRWSLSG